MNKQDEIVKELMLNAPVLETMLVARSSLVDAVIDLLVDGFREMLEKDKDTCQPDFTDGPMNSYAFYMPVLMLLDKPDEL